MKTAPLIGISRMRIGTDGPGVTTLVAFHGCPLRCKYCLNPQCNEPDGVKETLSAEALCNRVKKDELYFLATKGGLCFGGGEPLLHAEFIAEVMELGAKKWHTTIETSLNVPREKLEILLPYIDHYIIDIKDMDLFRYLSYTGATNDLVVSNLKWLVEQGKANDAKIRVPLIYKYNTKRDRLHSVEALKEMGFSQFDLFTYKTDKELKDRIKRRLRDILIPTLDGIEED